MHGVLNLQTLFDTPSLRSILKPYEAKEQNALVSRIVNRSDKEERCLSLTELQKGSMAISSFGGSI